MPEYQTVIELLEYNARCLRLDVACATRGVFGGTYEEAVKAKTLLEEYEKAIAILKAQQ